MHDTQSTDNNDRPMGTCPICHDRHVAFDPAGRDRGRPMAQCGACGSIVPLADVERATALSEAIEAERVEAMRRFLDPPKVQGGDGPTEPDRRRQNRSYAEVEEDDGPIEDDDLAVRLLNAIRIDATQLLDLLDDLDEVDPNYYGEVQTELEGIAERLTLIIEGTVDTLRGRRSR